MNVKTATKGFPKEELLQVVDEIKGKSDEARRQRRARRGKLADSICQDSQGWQPPSHIDSWRP